MNEKAVYLLISVLFIFGTITYFVQQRTNDYLQNKIDDLERRIARIDSVLSRGDHSIDAVNKIFPDDNQKAKWLKIAKGMTVEQVTELLGVPSRIQTSRNSMNYEYKFGRTSGFVFFDEKQLVERWDEPIF